MKLKVVMISSLLGLSLVASTASAAVSQQEARKLGTVLTPMGAEKMGNASGTIPAWTGSMNGVPAGLSYMGSGDTYPDPYANDKMLYKVTAKNMAQYDAYLSEGLKGLLKKYPDTYSLHVYPSHRDGRWAKLTEARTLWNATHTVLVNGVDGLQAFTGGAPFPIPKNAAEVVWNARIIHPHPTIVGKLDDVAVYPNGKKEMRRQEYISQFPYAYPQNKVGDTEAQIGQNAGLVLVKVLQPDTMRGMMTVVREATDQVKNQRMAWVYMPGTRRVRRAPTVGYDTPDGPGGLMTVDDALGFNGAMDRYNWTLLGKKEMLIPYANYKFDSPKVSYDQLLLPGHENPDYVRYEMHRVWVVEANLKKGARHVYAKRRFYIDEDSWQFVLNESYDGRGNLWRVGVLTTLYDFALKGFIARAQIYHDLNAGAYIATRLVNAVGEPNLMAVPEPDAFFSPSNLRTLGRR